VLFSVEGVDGLYSGVGFGVVANAELDNLGGAIAHRRRRRKYQMHQSIGALNTIWYQGALFAARFTANFVLIIATLFFEFYPTLFPP